MSDHQRITELETGRILMNGADLPIGLTPTAFAEAVAHLETVEILDELEFLLLPCENPTEIASQWTALLDEVERRPGMGDLLTDDELEALLGPGDNNNE